MRPPKYPASGVSIYADPLATISPAGRTFYVFSSDGLDTGSGVVSSSGSNGLVFYDGNRECFLGWPVFSDTLSNTHPTATQLSIVNEFSLIETWNQLQAFFLKLDKILLLEQFQRYLSGPDADGRGMQVFVERASIFCVDHHIHLSREELECPSGFATLTRYIAALPSLNLGVFTDAIPDLHADTPDPLLANSQETLRAERWLSLVQPEILPEDLQSQVGQKSQKLRHIVNNYMELVESWEGSPLMDIEGTPLSRRDAEELLLGAGTIYSPSPLGFTSRLRIAFSVPEALAQESIEVQIAFVSALERRLTHDLGFNLKLLYLKDRSVVVIEALGGGDSREVVMSCADVPGFERKILFAPPELLKRMVFMFDAMKATMVPSATEKAIQEARATIAHGSQLVAEAEEQNIATRASPGLHRPSPSA